MPIYHNGNKVASIYHMGNKVARAYHMGNLVYDSSGGDTEPPVWDIGHYNNAVLYTTGKTPQTQVSDAQYAAVTTLGGTPANLYYPTTTMEGSILLFDRTPQDNKLFLCQPPNVTGLSIWNWEVGIIPNAPLMALQRATKPIVDNAGKVVFITDYPYWRKLTVNTANLTVTEEQLLNNASLTQAELQAIKWYDSPHGLTAILVRYGLNSRVDVVRCNVGSIDVVATNTTATTSDLRYVQLLPNGNLTLKQNAYVSGGTIYHEIIEYYYSILSNNNAVTRDFIRVDGGITSGTTRNLIFDNAGNSIYDCLALSTARIVKTPFSENDPVRLIPPANVTSLDGAIRCPSNHFMILDSNNQFAFADMTTFATTRSFFSYTASENAEKDHNNRMCVLPNGRIVFFKKTLFQYTDGYNSNVPVKTACSPFFGK